MNKKYEASFKTMAVELVESGRTIRSVANDLGIREDTLSKWRRKFKEEGANSFSGKKKILNEQEKEILRLKRSLRSVQEERDILKKVVSIFSVSDKKNINL